jgi:hypothetical protein
MKTEIALPEAHGMDVAAVARGSDAPGDHGVVAGGSGRDPFLPLLSPPSGAASSPWALAWPWPFQGPVRHRLGPAALLRRPLPPGPRCPGERAQRALLLHHLVWTSGLVQRHMGQG